MLVSELITDEIPPLKTSDTVELALDWMEQFKVSHLAVVQDRQLLGIVSENDLMDYEHPEQTIKEIKVPLMKPIIHHYQHTYDLVKLMNSLNLTLVPVLDDKEMYKGCITLKGIVQNLSNMTAIQNPGGVIVLEMNQNDYSVTQIGNIIEGNDAKILSLHVSSVPDSVKLEVTIKVNKEDMTRILQTFNRYNYTVKATFHQGDFETGLKDKLNEFLHFLNI
ncbi:MAG: CBS domain-containing protein [Bacteroidia bacterium]|jgi:acetoin utilization protein AcuB|nr:CBS domain-containing protein [Sphingobacteriaceae bacterium]MBK7309578.1 CBS domain-containing protein [Sphingobacteriaceae bacterium]MBK7817859.1 CBS domain-containing protein [Sphingobacteriaceae bacterium]MBP9068795.1 CBS domain-containing protein [Bacteroidia bacterium]